MEIEDFLEVENWLNISLKLLLSSAEVDGLASEATDMRVPLVISGTSCGVLLLASPDWRCTASLAACSPASVSIALRSAPLNPSVIDATGFRSASLARGS
jgi:hypothetical protein